MTIIIQLLFNSIIAGAIYSLVALGFNLIYSTTRFFNLAHGVLAAVGGYTVYALGGGTFSILLGIILAGLIGYLLEILIYRPLRKRKASNMVLLVASLGAFTTIQALIAILFTSQFQTLSSGTQRIFKVFSGVITQTQVIILICAVLIMLALALFLKKTKTGKYIRAVSDDEEVAKIVGINTNKIIALVFFIGSAIAGLAGILVGFDTGIEPTMGMNLLLKGVIAAIIGGVGNVYGGVAGAFLLGIVENFGIWKISGEWKDAIAFGLLILFLLFKPHGLFNSSRNSN